MRKVVLSTIALLVFAASTFAQTTLGRIVGTVRDQTGAVVPGATITVSNEATGQQIQSATTNNDGSFTIPQLPAASYTVKVEASGFKTGLYNEVKVEPSREYSLTANLEIGGASETVQVTAGTDLVNTTTPEISSTVVRKQITDLPLNGRNPIELIRLQAGVVGLPTRTSTTINGGRPTWTQLTQDGINIQDNFIRTNSLDFVPNRPTSDTVGEFTITTNTQGADAAGGASQVKLVTPSGTNQFHGALYEFNRNSALSANSWFNNATIDRLTGKTIARPFLNRNQFGGNIGGPMFLPRFGEGGPAVFNGKDRLFFFFSYEGFRQRTQTTQNNTIPVNDDLLTGTFRYIRPSDGSIQAINILNARPGVTLDARAKQLMLDRLPRAALVNNFDVGNSATGRLLNTGGYRFLQSDVNDRNQYVMRFDFQANDKNRFEFVHQRFKETDDRTDLDVINRRPKVFTSSNVKLTTGAWRWSPTTRLSNEFRVGANLAPVAFNNSEDFIGTILGYALGLTNREVTFQPQGRDTRTFQFTDNASYVVGNHAMKFGGSLQRIKVQPYNFANRFPTVAFGFSAAAPGTVQLNANDFPGATAADANRISPTDLANANALRSWLGGVITSVGQTFQANTPAGYQAGVPNIRNYTLDNWAFYGEDNWRIGSYLTLRLGLKWEYFAPLREDNNIGLLPGVDGRSVRDALLDPNGTVGFVKGGFYNKDLNNFAPSIGIAWDPFKNGKTSVRFGYTKAFVNEETVTVANTASANNAGLQSAVNVVNLYQNLNSGLSPITPPAFTVPRTYANQLAISPTAFAYGIDQNIKQPYVHQISVSIEREIGWDMAVEGRYVSTMGRDVWRGIDLNQTNAAVNTAFSDDFIRARNNGFLALAQPNGAFNPAFNAAIPGSQQLTVIPNFGGGSLTNNTVRTLIQQGQVASLADFFTSGSAGAAVGQQARTYFYAPGNPGIYQTGYIINGGTTDYHALQLELRRRLKNGIFAQANYTFSKVLTNSPGTAQSRFEPYIDNNRQQLEKVRADFDVTHVLNASVLYNLPFGRGEKFLSSTNGVFDRIIGGWQISSIIHAQSGAPISLLSGRGTFNRGGRSGGNPVNSSLSREQIKDLFGIKKLADGKVYYIDPKVIDPATGRGVGPDNQANTAGFAGQVFFHPNAGQIGALQRLQFDGPSQTSWDFGIIKRVRIDSENKRNLEIRADFFNVLNHPLFFVGDYNVDSATFGRITGLNFGARVTQVAMKLNF